MQQAMKPIKLKAATPNEAPTSPRPWSSSDVPNTTEEASHTHDNMARNDILKIVHAGYPAPNGEERR
jgi:hypothetical protein